MTSLKLENSQNIALLIRASSEIRELVVY